jgi:hypothetical protein
MPGGLKAQTVRSSSSIVEDDKPTILDRIGEGDVALAIWSRPAPTGLAGWLDTLPPGSLPSGRFVATPAEVPAGLTGLCDAVGLPDGPERTTLISDVAGLAKRFARLAGGPRVDVRLEALDNDSCWRFHRDHVGLRLNTTYRGPGTQWPPPDEASRAQRAQRRYRGSICEMPRFAVGLFKGVRAIGQSAVLHRSPPISGSGVTRLFLCINEEREGD